MVAQYKGVSWLMSKLNVAEIFYSLQGEGVFQGTPSIFLRVFGCNFRCPAFGVQDYKGGQNQELAAIVPYADQYKSYKDLPLVQTGCDSYASWHPAFKHLSREMTIEEIADEIVSLIPSKKFSDNLHLVITGGEPLLSSNQEAYISLINYLHENNNLTLVTFETNGTQPLTSEFEDYFIDKIYDIDIVFSVSPKLTCSGVSRSSAIKPDIVASYMDIGGVYLKFVVATQDDVDEVLQVIPLFKDAGCYNAIVYLMPVGGVESVYILNNRTVADLALKYELRYSDRLQVPLFKNAWGT